MAVGGYLGGLFFDVFGSYTPAFLFSFAVGSINLILTIYIFWWTRREFRHIDAPRLVSTPAPAPAST